MMAWAVILGVGAGSFLFRVGPLLLLQRAVLSEATDRAIRYAGLAAISALIAVSVRQAAHGSSVVPTVVAVAVGVVLALRGASMLRIILLGGGLYAGVLVVIGVLAR
jgi:branched-subunit amino acid transport protein